MREEGKNGGGMRMGRGKGAVKKGEKEAGGGRRRVEGPR
jgi:hypothetical protein